MENIGALPLATVNVAFNLPALYFVAAIAMTVVVQLMLKKHRHRQSHLRLQNLSDVITKYFGNLGIEVSVSCFSVLEDKRFIAVIESEPIKKFRHSYIIEQALLKHLAKSTGHQVEKIYWRFPFSPVTEGLAKPAASHPDLTDPYHAEGPAKTWAQAGYQVEDASWENYEKAVKSTHPDVNI